MNVDFGSQQGPACLPELWQTLPAGAQGPMTARARRAGHWCAVPMDAPTRTHAPPAAPRPPWPARAFARPIPSPSRPSSSTSMRAPAAPPQLLRCHGRTSSLLCWTSCALRQCDALAESCVFCLEKAEADSGVCGGAQQQYHQQQVRCPFFYHSFSYVMAARLCLSFCTYVADAVHALDRSVINGNCNTVVNNK